MNKWLIYLNERFPLQSHIPIIGSFTFSAICFSYLASDKQGGVLLKFFIPAFILTFTLFFLLRVSDEFKDYEDDLQFRKYLPVSRGLISLKELKKVAIGVFFIQLITLIIYPFFLIPYLFSLLYLAIMHYEFFMSKWLKKRQWLYVISHMAIIPLVDLVASAAHWSAYKIAPPKPLIFFFIISLFNGIILEVGRKMKPPNLEENGVISYTSLLGVKKASILWLIILSITFCLVCIASITIDTPKIVLLFLIIAFIFCSLPSIKFINKPTKKHADWIEKASGLWTIIMYFSLGIIPFLLQL